MVEFQPVGTTSSKIPVTVILQLLFQYCSKLKYINNILVQSNLVQYEHYDKTNIIHVIEKYVY